MNESIIIQKLIQVGQMLERGKLGYSGAEIDTKHYLEQYVALRQPSVVGRREQLKALLSKVVDEFDSGEVTWDTRDEIENVLKSL